MANKKFSQFPPGGTVVVGDEIVGLRSGTNYKFTAPTGQLLSSNNLSDVADLQTSRVNLQVPRTAGFDGDPNGNVAGLVGDFITDSLTDNLYHCITAGDNLTAVWDLASNSIESVFIDNDTAVQLLSNKIYISRVNTPTNATGIMPVSPAVGDFIIIHCTGSEGIQINRVTASVTISGTPVASHFFVSINNSIVLRCVGLGSGGKWVAESINSSVFIDNTTTQNEIGNIQLNKANNLSDVEDVQTSRDNLSVAKRSSGLGSPQGVVAGELNDTYIDTVAPSNKFYVCIVAGNAASAVWQLQSDVNNALLIPNNLSDVADPSTSLTNIGGLHVANNLSDVQDFQSARTNLSVGKVSFGTGSPQGVVAGAIGDTYVDISGSADNYYLCITAGTSVTAVWQLQVNSVLESINIDTTSTVQMLSNRIYVSRVSSPSPTNSIMPISPSLGDILILHASGAAGATIQKGTAGVVQILETNIVTNFSMPVNSCIVLRCYATASGGQWRAESVVGLIFIDSTKTVGNQPLVIQGSGNPNGTQAGTAGINYYYDESSPYFQLWQCITTGDDSTAVWTQLVSAKNSRTVYRYYFSATKGNDVTGNGSEDFPYATYGAAVSAALLVALEISPVTVFAMGPNTVIGDLELHPFVNIESYNSADNSLRATGQIKWAPSVDTTTNAKCFISNISLRADLGCDFTNSVSLNQKLIFSNAPFFGTPTVNIEGSGGADNEVYLFFNSNSLDATPPSYTTKNVIFAIENCSASNISADNEFTSNQTLCILINNSTPGAVGDVTIEGNSPYPGTVLYSVGTYINNLFVNGDSTLCLIDSLSYASSISFSGGASFGSFLLLDKADAILANNNFTPVNYPLPVATLYPQNSVTNNLAGIDQKIGEIVSGLDIPISYLTRFTSGQMVPLTIGYSVVPLTVDTATGTDFTVNLTNGTVTYTGTLTKKFSITFNMSVEGSVATNINFAIGVNGTRDILTEQVQSVQGLARPDIITLNWIETLATGDFINLTANPLVGNTFQMIRGGLIIHSV